MTYDPHRHAGRLGLRVEYADLGPHLHGLYLHQDSTVLLRPGMTYRAERSTLAHEIVHHEHGDDLTNDRTWSAKREARCDRIAAHRLIDPLELEAAMRATDDAAEWCRTLDVLPWVITTYLQEHHRHAA